MSNRQAGQSLVGIMSNKLEWHITWRDISDEDKSIHVKDKAPNAGVVKLVSCASKLRLYIGTALLCGKLRIQLPSTWSEDE